MYLEQHASSKRLFQETFVLKSLNKYTLSRTLCEAKCIVPKLFQSGSPHDL